MSAKLLSLFCMFIVSFSFILEGQQHPKQRIPCNYEKEFVSPEAFEKVYVDGSMILSMPQGTFLKYPDGSREKVRVLSHDCKGMYVLRIKTQCPHCGKIYTGRDCPEGWNCLKYEKEIMHHIWVAP